MPGKHEALVSLETWLAVQARMKGTAIAPVYKNLREDFPLRGFVSCGSCGGAAHGLLVEGTQRSLSVLPLRHARLLGSPEVDPQGNH